MALFAMLIGADQGETNGRNLMDEEVDPILKVCDAMSCRVVSCRAMSCRVVSCRGVAWRGVSCNIM